MVFAVVRQKGNRVIVEFNGVPKDDKELDIYLNQLVTIFNQKVRFLILYDAQNIGALSWKHIHKQAAFMKHKEHLIREYMCRIAIIVPPNPLMRSMLRFLFKLRKPAAPCEVYTDRGKAELFLRKANLAFSETIEDHAQGPDADEINDEICLT